MIESGVKRRSACFLLILSVSAVGVCAQTAPLTPSIAPQVDERVELLSIVWRLAGSPEYNMNTLPNYSQDIDRYFAPYRDDPAVKMAQTLERTRGVSFDAVMAMAISLSPPPALQPLVPFSDSVPDPRWGIQGSEKFLPLLRDFYRDSKFEEFYRAHSVFYQLAESRFATTLSAVDFGWYSRFYGEAPKLTYHLILGMNNGGGNYGPRLVHPDGSMELFSIIGCWTHDNADNPTYPPDKGYLSTIIHEFNHSFVNPAVSQHWGEFSSAEKLYAVVAAPMQRIAYANAQTMVDESLVRAAVIVYFQDRGEDGVQNLKRIRQEQRLGFFWMDRLVELLNQYQGERAKYPDFSSFMPQVASFYRELAPHATQALAAFDAKSAHVIGIEPFTNHAQDVDPSLQSITILIDKPLDPKAGISINYGPDGREHYPIVGIPAFDAGGRHILLPVQLKPNQAYSFVLTPARFATPDGYPLESYTVEFKTK
ncbi:MAG TPA: DUF4932 domain-containing protein [Terracidiphilus sp.]|nr:DUF4932 domain-containing protein [Terracidiphilus sp.]